MRKLPSLSSELHFILSKCPGLNPEYPHSNWTRSVTSARLIISADFCFLINRAAKIKKKQ